MDDTTETFEIVGGDDTVIRSNLTDVREVVRLLIAMDPRGQWGFRIIHCETGNSAFWSDILKDAIRYHIDKKVNWKEEGF